MVMAFLWVRSHFRSDIVARIYPSADESNGIYRDLWLYSDVGSLNFMLQRFEFHGVTIPGAVGRAHWICQDGPASVSFVGPIYPSNLNYDRPGFRGRGSRFHGWILSYVHFQSWSWKADGGSTQASKTSISIPHWVFLILLLILPALQCHRILANNRRRRRIRDGRCVHCGYDIRATPDRCPECGAEAALKRLTLSNLNNSLPGIQRAD
jgi:hypothetical protein